MFLFINHEFDRVLVHKSQGLRIHTKAVARFLHLHIDESPRHGADGKMYLYDIMDIKKETSNPFEP